MALKYPNLDCHAMRREAWVWCFLAVHTTLQNSFLSVVRRGVYHGLDLVKGQEWGVEDSIVAIRAERVVVNHFLSSVGEGGGGAGVDSISSLAERILMGSAAGL